MLAGAGALRCVSAAPRDGWEKLERFRVSCGDWIMGHLSFEMKESQYGKGTARTEEIGFPALYFFQPETVVLLRDSVLEIGVVHPGPAGGGRPLAEAIYREILGVPVQDSAAHPAPPGLRWDTTPGKEDYLAAVTAIQRYLARGDAYEVNFCIRQVLAGHAVDPVKLFIRLAELSPAPFSALYQLADRFLVSASPERFLMKEAQGLLSQPMKGTIRRGSSPGEDAELRHRLETSPKERSENVMAVDLVRNDLARTAQPGSVQVTELCGVYTFPQVHQLVSTVRALARTGVTAGQVLEAAFPMGSMTGAPKHRVLELIDRYEGAARGIYSGALGYFTPAGDFDFNVVIRSVSCDRKGKKIAVQTGSGITVYSDPESEWEECLLKGRALKQAVEQCLLYNGA
jgi:para-aminobenzoate synthetase component 1